jgi:NitT/TauT family transport system ATP-binding protein
MAGPLFRGIPRAEAEATARDWINRVGLKGFEDHHPHQLSGGMRKRVALAQTFINNPQVLLMDEPFSALDVQTRELMQEELLQLWAQAKSAVLFVTHDLDEAILLADRVAVLEAGELVEYGATGELVAHARSPAVRRLMEMPLRQAERVNRLAGNA